MGDFGHQVIDAPSSSQRTPDPKPASTNPGRETWPAGGSPVVFANRGGGPNLLIRAIWFVFVGSWLGAAVLAAAHVSTLSVIGAPLGFWLYNRIPTVSTLRPRSLDTTVRTSRGTTIVETSAPLQRPLLIRFVYFVLIGWWLSGLWYAAAAAIAVPIVTLPISVVMLDRIGGIATLYRH
jgi:uncharacterized membrane protein YccF (DUF307 family)